MSALSIGTTGMIAAQTALEVVGQNLSNTNTPGYDEEVPVLTPLTLGGPVGDGAEVASVQRQRDELLETAYTHSSSQTAATNAQVPLLQQVQDFVNTGTNNIDGLLSSFFSGVSQLTADPTNLAQRESVLTSLSDLTNNFNQTATGLDQLNTGTLNQINTVIGQINTYTGQIASLNGQIQGTITAGGDASGLEDQRDQLVNNLAQLADVRTIDQPDGVVNVLGTGAAFVVGTTATSFAAVTGPNNSTVVSTITGLPANLSPTGGQLASLLQFTNQTLPSFQGQLNTLAQSFAQGVDEVQATGLGSSGPQTQTNGTRPVASTTAVLADAGTQLPIQAGTLTIGITDEATGQRTLAQVAIDPATQSLQQLASDITSATNGQVQASVNATSGHVEPASRVWLCLRLRRANVVGSDIQQ